MFTLRQSITDSQTEISVNEIITGDAASQEGLLEIESEVIRYTNRDLHTFIGCTRGYSGSSAASHAKGTEVTPKAISDADVRITNVKVFTTAMGETLDYTLETPSNPGQSLVLTACHSASSSGTLTVNTVAINAGESKEFVWDKNSWVVETDSTGTSGISELTGDITAGPGTGSQIASLTYPITAPNGTAAAPSYSFDVDGTCGMRLDGGGRTVVSSSNDQGYVFIGTDFVNLALDAGDNGLFIGDGSSNYTLLSRLSGIGIFLKDVDNAIHISDNGSITFNIAKIDTNGLTLSTGKSLFLNTAEDIFIKGVNGFGIQVSDNIAVFGSDTNPGLIISLSQDQSQAALNLSNNPAFPVSLYSVNLELAFNDTTSTFTFHNYTGGSMVQFDQSVAAGETRLLVWDVDTASLQRVTVGASDSGGIGFKVLRIPN